MAKKKKTQLKPVVRGFATTSVPKKAVSAEEPASLVASGESGVDEPRTGVSLEAASSATVEHQVPEFDPQKAEEQSLQNLVDKLQEKTEKEISRTVKSVDVDRRFSKTLPSLELEAHIREHILRLALESQSHEVTKLPLDEPEDKLIARLGITYGVLRRLGFSEVRVEECLRAIGGVDLDEAYEWLYLHCSEDELEVDRRSYAVHEPRTPHTPRTISSSSNSHVSGPSKRVNGGSRLDKSAPAFVPSVEQNSTPTPPHTDLLTSFSVSSLHTPNTEADLSETDDPNMEYVRLKSRITDLTGTGRFDNYGSSVEILQKLRARLGDIKKHYFFDEKDAELQFQLERKRVDALALQARLRGVANDPFPTSHPLALKRRPPDLLPLKVSVHSPVVDIFDDDEQGPTIGILEILEEMPTSETSDQGVNISVRDMALPKHWAGHTPKKLLQETVSKTDRFAAISYRLVSGGSRVKRAAVTIFCEGGKTGDWIMEDVGCHDETQAEQYVATLALHTVTFTPSEGFAGGGTAASGGQTFFRLLPAVFRDLWDELETRRKASEDATNREVWAKLRTIVELKLGGVVKSATKAVKQISDHMHNTLPRSVPLGSEMSSEHLQAGFRARQASATYQEMLVQRNSLPISQYRSDIVSALDSWQVLVLSGETGCGKSTQLPAFILENELSQGRHCKIICTEPRRISAISLAERVSRELGDPPGAVGTMNSLVGYSIRLESNTSRSTRLIFVTNGIALRMLEGGTGQGGQGTAFDEITHIIIDEVHERTIESDFLLIVLKSLLEERRDLKVVLMSATMDAEKISGFFGGCPIFYVPGRTFPVDMRFLEDAIELTKWSIKETSEYAKRQHDKFHRNGKNKADWNEEAANAGDVDDDEPSPDHVKLGKRYSSNTVATVNLLDERLIPYDLIIHLLERICFEDQTYVTYSNAILVFMPGLGEIRRLNDILSEHPRFGSSLDFIIYPLHSTISSENQGAVFDIPPPGVRKLVIATNIAETGITIPDITCVIDSGKHREMRFDEKRQISRLVETFIAKSNAAQRRGRAGRVQSGLCFHLFTKVRHDTQLAEHPLPEMMRLSLSDLALRIKIMKVKLGSSIEDVLSRALDPPSSVNIQRAISALVEVRALTLSEEITPMGRLLSKLPTDVHLGKFLLIAAMFRCLDPALTIAASLNSKSPFVSPFGLEAEADRAKNSFALENSDFLTLHNTFASWRRASANPSFVRKFCRLNFLSHQNLQQIEELRQQFLGYLIDSSFIHVEKTFIRELSRARYSRHRARFVAVPTELDSNSGDIALLNAALTAGLYPKILAIDPGGNMMKTISNNQPAAFHPSSVNFRKKPTVFGVNHLCYFTLMHSKKLYAWETGPVDDIAMLLLCGEADFKLVADSASIDRKIKYRVSPKTNVALKHLRTQLASILAQQFRGKPLTESQLLWHQVALKVIGKVKLDSQEGESIPRVIVN